MPDPATMLVFAGASAALVAAPGPSGGGAKQARQPALIPAPATMLVFAGASAALVAVPGPAVLYIVSRSIAHGRRAGIVSMLGIESGNVVQVLAATVGLSALVASS